MKSLPNFFPRKAWVMHRKKWNEGTWRPMNIKKGHMKIHANRRWLAMPKIFRRERLYMEHLASHFIHHISTHMHFMVVWLIYFFGVNLWLCKIFETSMPYFSPYHELHISLLEIGERRRTKDLIRVQTLWAIRECYLRNLFSSEKSFKTSRCKVEQGMSEWWFMNRSISQLPKTRRKPKAPWRLR